MNRVSPNRDRIITRLCSRVWRLLLASVLVLDCVCPAPDVVIGSLAERFHRIQEGVELPVLTRDADTVVSSEYD